MSSRKFFKYFIALLYLENCETIVASVIIILFGLFFMVKFRVPSIYKNKRKLNFENLRFTNY